MIFEWRSYVSEPRQEMAYLDLFRTFGVRLVTRHLPMLGYRLSDVGGLNVFHHLWAYENFDDRMSRRAGLASETAWQTDFIVPAFRTILSQESRFMTLVSGSEAFDALVAAGDGPRAAQPPDECCVLAGRQKAFREFPDLSWPESGPAPVPRRQCPGR